MSSNPTTNQQQQTPDVSESRRRRGRPTVNYVESSESETSLPDLTIVRTVENDLRLPTVPAAAAPLSTVPAVNSSTPSSTAQPLQLAPPPQINLIVVSDTEDEQVTTRTPLIQEYEENESDDDDFDMYETVDTSLLPEVDRTAFCEIQKQVEKFYCGICCGFCSEPVYLPCSHFFCAR